MLGGPGAPGLGQKNHRGAEPLLLSGYEGMKEREANPGAPGPQGNPRLTEAPERLVQLYGAWGKPDQAAEWRAKLKAAVPGEAETKSGESK